MKNWFYHFTSNTWTNDNAHKYNLERARIQNVFAIESRKKKTESSYSNTNSAQQVIICIPIYSRVKTTTNKFTTKQWVSTNHSCPETKCWEWKILCEKKWNERTKPEDDGGVNTIEIVVVDCAVGTFVGVQQLTSAGKLPQLHTRKERKKNRQIKNINNKNTKD